MKFKLDVDDAIVTVTDEKYMYWNWKFTWNDGSYDGIEDSNWAPTERAAKEAALTHYRSRTKKLFEKNQKRARWIKESPK